ncbi:lysophospholipid acyltransferase family protein [Weeksella virosa]|uniref:Phospholipid/glycerol acyltransferase n=1 Tax=Weeksella virosa (strain ATCC 43766 / DSM 16922 / JCM 21250 / CCUG 30538 / CDC 9751 / IAM 14551 / NBRC 16016 / NCTC 11634 / CL345/78) TaxID=865938 RepID=F0P2L1_WEEVC|nr:lysophospholipid acyltransferase family protein [Weeksella virosa]ADX67850.1 phospholipid/glycerol acyltransferase [Weeksella virosa DSM 16922]VEH64523.1 2-acyl-glycerophospho-ethanolamine acyltransferase [Weeksella virosa]
MGIVSTDDIYKALGLQKLGVLGKPIAWSLIYITRLNVLNNIYNRGKDLPTDQFLDFLLDDINVDYEIHEEDLNRIPKTGPFIILANHPLGALDGIIMMHAIGKVRPDFKVMGNFLLHQIKPLETMVIPVNPFETRKEVYNSLHGLRVALSHLEGGGGLGIFPAGEVSFKNEEGEIVDRVWQDSAIRLVQKAKVPVVPMFFRARNSKLFYRMSQLHPDVQTAMLPSEMIRKRTKPIQIRIGKPILPKTQEEYKNVEQFRLFLRRKVYILSSYYGKKNSLRENLSIDSIKKLPSTIPSLPLKIIPQFIPQLSRASKPKVVISETQKELLLSDIGILNEDPMNLLFTSNQYECYFALAQNIPNILRELGRLREITFRAIGEGTNHEIDLDWYDNHYHHLFLWDKENERIVGAYRMALGADVYEKYGVKGFYISELFNFEPEIHPFFKKCIEMGRAFVVEDYQQKPMPLFLLWRGIVHVTLRNPHQKYIIGGVSISNQFSDFSKSLMIEFMRSHYFDPIVAQYVHAKNEYKVKLKEEERSLIFEDNADLNKFDKLIDELEPNMLRLPVLIKKYIKQNAKVIAFNVDPKFNDAIDGLMYIRISDLPESTVKPVLEDIQAELERKLKEEKSKE